jgi:hypothetical protein
MTAFHPSAQRNAFRRPGVRLQSRSCVRWNQSPDDPVADEGRACHFDSNRHNNTNTKANSHVHAHGNPITIAIANRYGYTESKSIPGALHPFPPMVESSNAHSQF